MRRYHKEEARLDDELSPKAQGFLSSIFTLSGAFIMAASISAYSGPSDTQSTALYDEWKQARRVEYWVCTREHTQECRAASANDYRLREEMRERGMTEYTGDEGRLAGALFFSGICLLAGYSGFSRLYDRKEEER